MHVSSTPAISFTLLLLACGNLGSRPQPTSPPSTPQQLPRTYVSDWHNLSEGDEPSDFVDVQADGHRYPWLYPGGWRISRQNEQTVYEVPEAKTDMPEPLTFRRYDGDAFGPRGSLPPRYRITVEGRSLGGAVRFNGYGELAVQAFYVSPVTYVEVLQTDTQLMIWQANNAPPMQGSGWQLLAYVANPTPIGSWVKFGAIVDTTQGTLTATLNEVPVASASSPLLKTGQPGKVTLRATGNREEWRSLRIRELLD